MNDPHVVRLRYHVLQGENVVLQNPPTWAWLTPEEILHVEASQASIVMTRHYSTEDEARAAVKPYLDSWEVAAGLAFPTQQKPFWFRFNSAEIIDLAPKGTRVRSHSRSVPQSAAITINEPLSSFPPPPTDFTVNEDVERMWSRWEQYKTGRETLPSAAYYCLTVLEGSMGGKKREFRHCASQHFGVDIKVLNTLGELVSEVGDEYEARKAHRAHRRPYTHSEREWIESVVLALIRRVGEVVASPNARHATICMSAFPSLDSST